MTQSKCRRRSMLRRECRRPTWWISEFFGEFWIFEIALTLTVNAFEIAWLPKLLKSTVDEVILELNMMTVMIMKTTVAWWWWCDGCEEMIKSLCQRCLQDHYDDQIPTYCRLFVSINGDVFMVMPIWLCCCCWWWWCADNDEHGRIKFLASRFERSVWIPFSSVEHFKKSRNLKKRL